MTYVTTIYSFFNLKKKKTDPTKKKSLQKFIFSATLTLPKSFKNKGRERNISKGEALGKSCFSCCQPWFYCVLLAEEPQLGCLCCEDVELF